MANEAYDQAIAIVREKGILISSADLAEIEYLLTQLDADEAADRIASVFEALSLIVNDPLYTGDIPPID